MRDGLEALMLGDESRPSPDPSDNFLFCEEGEKEEKKKKRKKHVVAESDVA